jgi:hypothetical protein
VEVFDATIVEADRGGAYVRVPPDVVTALGGKGRTPVRGTFDGVAYRGSVVSMGGEKILGVLKDIRAQLSKHPGDLVTVTLEVDDGERTAPLPDDLLATLEGSGLSARFTALSYSHQQEYASWINEAKKPDTRHRRINQTIDRLRG